MVWLQLRQAVTTFIQLSRPPCDTGNTWSRVNRCEENSRAQYAQMWRSRWNSSRLDSGVVGCSDLPDSALPRIAMMLLYTPYVPNKAEYLILSNRNILADQMDFLARHVPSQSRVRAA